MSDDRPKTDRELEPDEPASEQEFREAQALAQALDQGSPPEIASADLRDALATAQMVRASSAPQPLSRDRAEALVGDVLSIASQASSSRRRRRLAPLLALAASVVFVAGALLVTLPRLDKAGPMTVAVHLGADALSRPSNDLLGRPIEDRAGAAARLDQVFDDRLNGFRTLRLGRGR